MTASHRSTLTPEQRDELWRTKYGRPLPPRIKPPTYEAEKIRDQYEKDNGVMSVALVNRKGWRLWEVGHGAYAVARFDSHLAAHNSAVQYAHKLAYERSTR